MQWTERHIVLLLDKQIFEVPPHRTGNIGPMRGSRDPFGIARAYDLVLEFSGFKREMRKF
jgi:hypothetical protein